MATAVSDIEADTKPPARRRPLLVGAALVVVAAVVIGVVVARHSTPPGSVVPAVNPAVERVWGLRASQLAASGDGGFVDFRFVVVDADKAVAMMQDVNKLPLLKVESSGKILNSVVSMSTRHDLANGRTYFLLYRDDAGVIKKGTHVSIVFHDGSTIEHVKSK